MEITSSMASLPSNGDVWELQEIHYAVLALQQMQSCVVHRCFL
jgi:hypothetical protein